MRKQEVEDLHSGDRRAEQISLHLGAAEDVQQIPLLLGLDAFGGRRHVACGRDGDDGLDDRGRSARAGKILD
jgi:hypothetical protein